MTFPLDRLDLPGLPGQVGLGFAPGRRTRRDSRDLYVDLKSLRREQGFTRLVCFLEAHEMDALGIPDLLEKAEAVGLGTLHAPIEDGGTPESKEAMNLLTTLILTWLAAGEHVFLHCWAGLGRTGMVASACLIARGLTPAEALKQVRMTRPGSVETAEQEAFLESYARWRVCTHPGALS